VSATSRLVDLARSAAAGINRDLAGFEAHAGGCPECGRAERLADLCDEGRDRVRGISTDIDHIGDAAGVLHDTVDYDAIDRVFDQFSGGDA